MGAGQNQGLYEGSRVTVRLRPQIRLAGSERERLWTGLERFVNCRDSWNAYQELSSNFGNLWPAEIWHFRYTRGSADKPLSGLPELAASGAELSDHEESREAERSDQRGKDRTKKEFHFEVVYQKPEKECLNWYQACHKLFLFYRDTLRAIWSGEDTRDWPVGGREEFLLGLTNFNQEARDQSKNEGLQLQYIWLPKLFEAWREILDQFPNAEAERPVQIRMLWKLGDFVLLPNNDFQRAFYILFRQNWRARVCRGCKTFFIARKPKQIFCGTVCSAGNRLASKRKWWNRVGVKRRTEQRKKVSERRSRRRRRRP